MEYFKSLFSSTSSPLIKGWFLQTMMLEWQIIPDLPTFLGVMVIWLSHCFCSWVLKRHTLSMKLDIILFNAIFLRPTL